MYHDRIKIIKDKSCHDKKHYDCVIILQNESVMMALSIGSLPDDKLGVPQFARLYGTQSLIETTSQHQRQLSGLHGYRELLGRYVSGVMGLKSQCNVITMQSYCKKTEICLRFASARVVSNTWYIHFHDIIAIEIPALLSFIVKVNKEIRPPGA